MRLPRDADVNAAHADHVDGILVVTFPKKELDLPHPGVECDKSGMKPIRGKRYHLSGHNFDLCAAEWQKLGERERALYTAILPPPKRMKLDVPVAATDETPPEYREEAGETPRPYTLSLSAAGVKPSDLQLTIDDLRLAVRGETKATGARVREHFRLPRDADAEKARAASVDGLLTVTIPKKLIVPVTIPINGMMNVRAKHKEEDSVMVQADAEAMR